MKNLKQMGAISLLTMGALPLLLASCSSNGDDPINSSENEELTEIRLAGNVISGNVADWLAKANTRTSEETVSYTTFQKDETVNVTVNETSTNKANLYQQALTSDANGLLKGTKNMFYPTDGTNVDIYLYKGNYTITKTDDEEIVKANTKFTVTALTNQTSKENQDASDFIYGQKINLKRSASNVEVTMAHLMSQFNINVTANTDKETADLGLKLKTIELVDLINSSTYTIDDTKVDTLVTEGVTTKSSILLYSNEGVALDKDLSIDGRAIVLPQDMSGKVLKFTTDSEEDKYFSYTFPKGTEYKPGKNYVYNVTISAMSLNVVAKIKDWDTQSTVDIEAGYDVP
jgi:hypothetical protein